MNTNVVSFRIEREISKALEIFANKSFNGSKADALRYILTDFFSKDKTPEIIAALAVYNNLIFEIRSGFGRMASAATERFDQEIHAMFADIKRRG